MSNLKLLTLPTCPPCKRARQIIEEHNIECDIYDWTTLSSEDKSEFQDIMNGVGTVPQLFQNDIQIAIGGGVITYLKLKLENNEL